MASRKAVKNVENPWTPERIRALRRALGKRQEDFCVDLGVALSTLRHWEQDKGRPYGPAQKLLDRIADDLATGRIVPDNSKSPALAG